MAGSALCSALLAVFCSGLADRAAATAPVFQRDVCCGNYTLHPNTRKFSPVLSVNLADVIDDVKCFHRVCASPPASFRVLYTGSVQERVSVVFDLCDVTSSHGWSSPRPPNTLIAMTGRCLCMGVHVTAKGENSTVSTAANDTEALTVLMALRAGNEGGKSPGHTEQSDSMTIGYTCHVSDRAQFLAGETATGSDVTGWKAGVGVSVSLLLLLLLAAALYFLCWPGRRNLPKLPDLNLRQRLASVGTRLRRCCRSGDSTGNTSPRPERSTRDVVVLGPFPACDPLPPQGASRPQAVSRLHPTPAPTDRYPPLALPSSHSGTGQSDSWEYEDVDLGNLPHQASAPTVDVSVHGVTEDSVPRAPDFSAVGATSRPRFLQAQLGAEAAAVASSQNCIRQLPEVDAGRAPKKRKPVTFPKPGFLFAMRKAARKRGSQQKGDQGTKTICDSRDVTVPKATEGDQSDTGHSEALYDDAYEYSDYDDDEFDDFDFDNVQGETDT